MSVRIQVRRGTASAWTSANPVLSEGEPGFETDTGKWKFGDGVRTWTALPYEAMATDITVAMNSAVAQAEAYTDAQIATISLTPGPKGDKGDAGNPGILVLSRGASYPSPAPPSGTLVLRFL